MSGIFKPGNTKPRVLIVDNNPEFTFRAHLFLQHTGRYLVWEENDPLSVLETARAFQPDLILLDLIMPELDGAEVAAQLGADWTLRRVPIVFLTALITPEEARHVRRIDGHRLVAKPVSSPDLVRIIEESLPSWRAAA
jgi:two-component system, OmpR family, response regulator